MLLAFVLALLGLAAFTFGLLTAIAAQIPQLETPSPQANTYVYASDGHTILAILRGSQARVIVPSSAISPWIKHAIVAVEDKRFYEHRGVDLRGILRAAWNDLRGRPVQGGSTITQQFIKNSINGSAPTLARKLREAALAWELEQRWPKEKILTAYLNTIYFGNGAYGVEQAARVYFGHDARTMTPAEAALLAGIPEDPSLWDPVSHPKLARARRKLVLRQMLDQGYLDRPQYATAIAAPMPKPQDVRLPSTQSLAAPYFANYVRDQLVQRYGAKQVLGGGMHVTTTIDLGLQKLAREAIAQVLPPSVGPTAALVALDAQTGAVLAMVGGRNYHQSQFNLATQGERQPGSAFKPFVLAAALREGIAPSTVFISHPVTIDAGGRLWKVNNYEGEYLGPITLSQALAYSDNSVFAQLTNVVGPPNVVAAAHALGITSPLRPYFSIGLGGEAATPVEMARAFGSLADNGFRVDGSIFGNVPRAIQCVQKPKDETCLTNEPEQRPALAASPELSQERAAIIDSLLQGVVQYGTGTAARIPGRYVAGKTGTTENYGDAWFVGFTPQIVAAVWVGYPNKLVPMLSEYHGRAVAGGTYPAQIWKAFMTKALAYLKLPVVAFPPPPPLSGAPVSVTFRNGRLVRDNGYCKVTETVDFFAGYQPPLADCKKNEVDVPDVRGTTLAAAKARLYRQPLLSSVVYKPARPGQRVSVVVGQIPLGGTLSAWDRVTLVLPKAQHGVVPRLVGLTVARAEARLARLKVDVRLRGGSKGTVVAQRPGWGVAAAPGMRVVLNVG
ncbi:MAG TPA: PBP1A family penicillin-binding protein [Gaiellaceae bacterium]|nr:PBP1A family penicillin-binding protein [Gaiellaceae bacterium]